MDLIRDVEAPLRAVNPSVRLVRDRHHRKAKSELLDAGHRLPRNHELPLRLSRQLAVELGSFPAAVTAGPEAELLLFTDPTERGVGDRSAGAILRHYWEAVFAAEVERLLQGKERWAELGPVLVAEAEFLLKSERKVPDDPTAEELYAAFGSEFLRTALFRPSALAVVFPSADRQAVLAVLRQDVEYERLLATTRPAGADVIADVPLSHFPERSAPQPERPSRVDGYAASGETASRKGNHAKAAVLHTKAVLASSAGSSRHRMAAKAELADHLVPRLAAVLEWNSATREAWAAALQPLLQPAAVGVWPDGAKALYDLQRVALDLARDLYAVDPASWVRSFGTRPMVRKLTLGRHVILLLHLKRVQRHIAHTPLAEAARVRLDHLLADEIAHIETLVRGEIAPKMLAAFDAAGLVPTSEAEAVARLKVVQELLDTACERGQIRLGHLRDALARNQLKLRDLAGPLEFLGGDSLLRADAELDRQLDGVYRRGEIYLRWIQRGSALAFGTRIGRALSLWLFMPVIAAFLTVEFAKYVAHEAMTVYHLVGSVVRYDDEPDHLVMVLGDDGYYYPEWAKELKKELAAQAKHGITIGPASLAAVGVLFLVFLGVIHSPWFRARCGRWLALLWRLLVAVVSLPFTVWRNDSVKAIRRHSVTRWVWRRVGLALLLAGGAALFLWFFGASPTRILRVAGFTFAITALFVNTPVGRWFTDETEEVLSDTWRRIRVNLIPNLFSWIVWLFKELLGAIDRMLYEVDEWLRFREGQSGGSMAVKVVAGVVWFPIAYVLRFVIYLFIEPQINPVKHFPVVTVSHKLLLPLISTLAPTFAAAMQISEEKSLGVLTVIIGCIPGVFGFIAWELQTNWRLYAANRPRRLCPVTLGHHGESMRGLLRPGFHSGTVPAAFKKARAAVRYADRSGTPAAVGKYLDALHHVEHAVQAFLERELVAALKRADGWQWLHLAAGHVRLGLQSVTAEVTCRELGGGPAVFRFTHRNGVISGAVVSPGFTAHLTDRQKREFDTAAAGVLAMAAVPMPDDDARVNWPEWSAFWDAQSAKPLASA